MARHTHVGRSLVSLVLLSLFLGLVSPASAATADATIYQDPNGAFSFTLPDGWQAQPPNSSSVLFAHTATGAAFSISTHPANGVSLGVLTQQATAFFPQLPGYQEDPGGVIDLTVGSQRAKGSSFQSNAKDGSQRLTLWVTVINQDALYLLLFLVPTDREQEVGADLTTILTSWQFS